jgi:tetratricopeptide (TPR) repeat protein
MDNFRVAWDWAIAHHEFDRTQGSAKTLWYLYELRTWFEEAEIAFRKAAESIQVYVTEIGGDAEILEIANELGGHAAFFMFRRGNTVAAYDALTIVRAQMSANASMYVQLFLGFVCRDLGKFTEAYEVLQDSLEKAKEHGDPWCQSMAGQFLGIIALEMGDHVLAYRYLMEALEVGREIGDPMLIAHALSFVSLTIQTGGEVADAEKFLRESLALTQKIGYRWGVGNALDGLGILAQKSNPHEARKLFAAVSEIYREIGDLRSLARALCHQGYNSLALNDIPEAQKSFMEALMLARKCNYTPYALDALAGIASVYAKRGDAEGALELLLIVLDHPASIQMTKERSSHLLAALETQLTLSQINTIQAHAQEKIFESVVEELLQ